MLANDKTVTGSLDKRVKLVKLASDFQGFLDLEMFWHSTAFRSFLDPENFWSSIALKFFLDPGNY